MKLPINLAHRTKKTVVSFFEKSWLLHWNLMFSEQPCTKLTSPWLILNNACIFFHSLFFNLGASSRCPYSCFWVLAWLVWSLVWRNTQHAVWTRFQVLFMQIQTFFYSLKFFNLIIFWFWLSRIFTLKYHDRHRLQKSTMRVISANFCN